MKPTTTNHPSGQELRRQAGEAFGPLFSKPRRVTEGSSLPADFVPVGIDDKNVAPPLKNGQVAKVPYACSNAACMATGLGHKVANYCPKCRTPLRPAESAVTANDPRRVHESADDDTTAKRLENLNLLELRGLVGARYATTPAPGPLSAQSLRRDMEQLASRKARQDAGERAALAAFGKQ